MVGAASKLAPLKLVFAVAFNVSHNRGQHLFVYINSRYWHWACSLRNKRLILCGAMRR